MRATTAQLYPGRDTFEFDQGHVTKNKPITVLILLSESLAIQQFQLFIFYKPACLQVNFHGRVLSIRVFSVDEHYGLIASRRRRTLSRHVINLNQQESEKI